MTRHLHQDIVVPSPPAAVYSALVDGARFAEFSGAPATIATDDGGTFACFGGMIHGRTVERVADTRVVQAWRAKNWTPGVYSLVHIELTADPAGTRISLDHSGFPDGEAEHLAQGWHANYWEPLKKLTQA